MPPIQTLENLDSSNAPQTSKKKNHSAYLMDLSDALLAMISMQSSAYHTFCWFMDSINGKSHNPGKR